MPTNNNEVKPIRRFNLVAELDNNADLCYVFFPPYSSKNHPKIGKHGSFTSNGCMIVFDYDTDGKLCGIEIPNASNHLNLPKDK